MSQPFQYSNLFFETDPNSLAAQLVNGTNATPAPKDTSVKDAAVSVSSSQIVSSKHGAGGGAPAASSRPPPRFIGFEENECGPFSQLDVRNNSSIHTSQPTASRPFSQQHGAQGRLPATPSVLSPNWGFEGSSQQLCHQPATPSCPLVTSQPTATRTLAAISSIAETSRKSSSSSLSQPTSRSLSSQVTRVNPSELLASEIVPRSSSSSLSNPKPCGDNPLYLALGGGNRSQNVSSISNAPSVFPVARIPASTVPTFRPPRPSAPAHSSSSLQSNFSVTNNNSRTLPSHNQMEEQEDMYTTSVCFEGEEETERYSRERSIPGPALDAWVITEDPDTQSELYRDENASAASSLRKRSRLALEEPLRYGCGGAFAKGPWLAFCSVFQQPAVLEEVPDSLIHKYNCDGVLRKGLGANADKVPFLAVVLLKVRYFEHYALASVADPTGVLEAEIHEGVLRSDLWTLQEGCAVVLRNITVCRPLFLGEETSTHTLIITMANVEQVFPPDEPVPQAFETNLPAIVSAQTKYALPSTRTTNRELVQPSGPDHSAAIGNNLSNGTRSVESLEPVRAFPIYDLDNVSSQQTQSGAMITNKAVAIPAVPSLPSSIPLPSHIAPKRRVEDFDMDEDEFELLLSRAEQQRTNIESKTTVATNAGTSTVEDNSTALITAGDDLDHDEIERVIRSAEDARQQLKNDRKEAVASPESTSVTSALHQPLAPTFVTLTSTIQKPQPLTSTTCLSGHVAKLEPSTLQSVTGSRATPVPSNASQSASHALVSPLGRDASATRLSMAEREEVHTNMATQSTPVAMKTTVIAAYGDADLLETPVRSQQPIQAPNEPPVSETVGSQPVKGGFDDVGWLDDD